MNARQRRLERLCLSLELDEFAASIIVDLLERMEEMDRELERWHALLQPALRAPQPRARSRARGRAR